MENQNESLQKNLTDNFQKISRLSIDTMRPLVENMFETVSNMSNTIVEGKIPTLNLSSFQNNKHSNCCPPKQECPPHCISTISRQAMSGERIIVPFLIKNNCSSTKTYRVGVRELLDNDGTLAPNQPVLNKVSVTLASGRSERVLMSLDLNNFKTGSTYTTEIVLREKEINQNICFTLHVNNSTPTEVSPKDEKQYKQKWLHWQSHFYCDPPIDGSSTNPNVLQNKS